MFCWSFVLIRINKFYFILVKEKVGGIIAIKSGIAIVQEKNNRRCDLPEYRRLNQIYQFQPPFWTHSIHF